MHIEPLATPEVAYEPPEEFLGAYRELSAGHITIRAGDGVVEIGRLLGSGGTKTVHDALLGDETFALALPSTGGGASSAYEKWRLALGEPASTDRLRELGCLVNPQCAPLLLTVNGYPLTGLKMTRFQDLPWSIRDPKNLTSSPYRGELITQEKPEDVERFVGDVALDAAVLVRQGILLEADSINFAVAPEGVRLYFSDMGAMEIQDVDPDSMAEEAARYASAVLNRIARTTSADEYRRVGPLIDDFKEYNAVVGRVGVRILEEALRSE